LRNLSSFNSYLAIVKNHLKPFHLKIYNHFESQSRKMGGTAQLPRIKGHAQAVDKTGESRVWRAMFGNTK